MSDEEILSTARWVIETEIQGLQALRESLGKPFIQAVRLILEKPGKVLVSGVGKSGIVAKKIAATLTSLGTPAFFLHPTESLHGDLGIVAQGDVLLALSKSGRAEEFETLIPLMKRWGVAVIALTADPRSPLARSADVVIPLPVHREACPYDVVPTTSTTIAMALGDALAMALALEKGVRLEDFASLHPGGAIGKRFWLKVSDMMLTGPEHVPVVREEAPMKEVIMEMTAKRGITSVVDERGRVVGVITDGDLRRLLDRVENPFTLRAREVMTTNPKVIGPDELAAEAARQMERYGITALIVVDKARRPIGIIHLHDLMRARVV